MINICNLRNEKIVNDYDIRIDRVSVLGNPYYMRSESERDIVCDRYNKWFDLNKDKDKVKEELDRLIDIYNKYGRIRLFCWCAPKRCHGETIVKYIKGGGRNV
jgi:hypothetical protein